MKQIIKRNSIIHYCLMGILLMSLSSCKKDTPELLKPKENNTVEEANQLLSGYIVLNTDAKMAGVSKTLLPSGCPTKFYFHWDTAKEKLEVKLPKFHVGNMPFAVVFESYVTYSELNIWEKKEYPGDGWVKFSANDGVVTPYVPAGVKKPEADGAAIIVGYVNPSQKLIEFNINYNMMNVTSFTRKQKIDKSRLQNYEKEFAQYEKDLAKYKKEHGLS